MDENDLNEPIQGLNPEPEELRQDANADAAKAVGRDLNDELQQMAIDRIEGTQAEPSDLEVNDFLDNLDAAAAHDAGEMPDAQAAKKATQSTEPRAWPAHQGVDPKELRRRRTEREQARNRARKGLPPLPVPDDVPEPDTKNEPEPPRAAANDGNQSVPPVPVRQAWEHRDKFTMPAAEIPIPDTGTRPPRDPDQRDEHTAVDQALAPIGNDKDLNNQLLQVMREYFDQERAFRHSMLNIWAEALQHLRADFARLEELLAAFERDRESY